jgi:hypothetical protein
LHAVAELTALRSSAMTEASLAMLATRCQAVSARAEASERLSRSIRTDVVCRVGAGLRGKPAKSGATNLPTLGARALDAVVADRGCGRACTARTPGARRDVARSAVNTFSAARFGFTAV